MADLTQENPELVPPGKVSEFSMGSWVFLLVIYFVILAEDKG